MKTKLFLAAIVMMGHVTVAAAQVLGTNAVGSIGGSLRGGASGMQDIGATGHATTRGAFESEFDRSALRRSARDMTGRTSGHVRSAASTARHRTDAAVSTTERASRELAERTRDRSSRVTRQTRGQLEQTAQAAQPRIAADHQVRASAQDANEVANAAATTAQSVGGGLSYPLDMHAPAALNAGIDSADQTQLELDRRESGITSSSQTSVTGVASQRAVRADAAASGSAAVTLSE